MSSGWQRLSVSSVCRLAWNTAPERRRRAGTWHCIAIIQSVFEWTDRVKICRGLTGPSFPVDNTTMNSPLDYPHLRQPHTTRHPSRDPTTPWHQSWDPNIVVQGERVPTEAHELKFECRFMASDVEERFCVQDCASGERRVCERPSRQTKWVHVSFRPGDYKPQ